MIQVSNVSKSFDQFQVLDDLNLTVKKGSIYGLVGVNGSGKTTIIKHIMGILKPDTGAITIGGEPVFDNIPLKRRTGFVPDDLYFFATYSLREMAAFYKRLYPSWNDERFAAMVSQFGLSTKTKLSKFSKGMQKQAAFILTMSEMPDYLVLDEPIDGLDPLVRKLVWKTIVDDVAEREMSVLVSSHNLRELESICDAIGILSKGAMMIERDLDELKTDIHKVQVAFQPGARPENPYEGLNILRTETRGSVDLLIIRNRKETVDAMLAKSRPAIFDMLPLSLEEIFIYELGGENDAISSAIF